MINKSDLNTEISEKIIPILTKAKKDSKVLAVALFGSSIKSNQHRDIDICLFLKNKISNLEMSDLKLKYLKFADKNIDIQIFQQLPLYIRVRILKEGIILLSKDEDRLYDIAFQTIKEFNLYEKLYEMYLEKIKDG